MNKISQTQTSQKIARLMQREGVIIDKILRMHEGDIETSGRKIGRLHFAVNGHISALKNQANDKAIR